MSTNKFNAVSVTVDGLRFSSRKEARRWAELRLLEKAGEIRNLKRQVKIPLMGQNGPLKTRTGRVSVYVADFVYEDRRLNWAEVIEDAKGFRNAVYLIKRSILTAQGVEVRET